MRSDGAVIDKYTVFNDRLQFLGDAVINTWFVAGLPPGKYTFVPNGKRPRPLQAETIAPQDQNAEPWARFAFCGCAGAILHVGNGDFRAD